MKNSFIYNYNCAIEILHDDSTRRDLCDGKLLLAIKNIEILKYLRDTNSTILS